ncbi:hypothetical protein EX30DRAFT_266164 [Ascodesmis nigricans]|uniref:Uncharacterized protein n=1 Tax=Ascodesmis nigricans TaxID=341454 RepID=A0A4S2MHB7_9PEZI|nr:hypothetical protein EX30DRAFT_266164 [Ascodesmis nigricans]
MATACNKHHYPPRALIRSFILDLSDPHIRSLFTPKDWTEITASISPLPAPTTSFLRSLPITSSLPVFERAVLDLRIERAANGSFSDRDLWLFSVLDRMTLLFRHPEALHQQHLELWYDMHIWSRVIDDAFFGSPTFFLERREGICVSTSERRNRYRSTTTTATTSSRRTTTTTSSSTRPPRHRLGTHLDGILRLTHSPRTELGAIETARAFTGENSTKWLSDSTKLTRTLHDMLVHLNRETRGDAKVLRKLQTVGIVNAGRAMQVKRLAWAAGTVCVLKTEERGEGSGGGDREGREGG